MKIYTSIIIACAAIGVFITGCKKQDKEETKKPPTKGMERTRIWTGSYYYYFISQPPNATSYTTAYDYPDTTFAITIVNDSSVQAFNILYRYEYTNDSMGMYYFIGNYGPFRRLYYFYKKDSIAIENDNPSTHSKEEIRWHTR